jgi:S-DNA-T family DNA segregation ATPase FtsK/SpoIIIE
VSDFSSIGAFVILLVTFVVGVILFFNTSIDIFILMVLEGAKRLAAFIYDAFFSKDAKKLSAEGKPTKGEFLSERPVSPMTTPVVNSPPKPLPGKGELTMKPLTGHSAKDWAYPPLSLLEDIQGQKADVGDIAANSDVIERTLDSFGIRARVAEINQGPTVTQYAIEIVMGTKLTRVTALSGDLALALAAPTGQVRIEAPIPGRSLVGIEIPNRRSEIVTLKRLLQDPGLEESPHPLTVPMGLDVSGKPVFGNLGKMPHILVAGTTGSGKSILLNAWLCNFLFRTTPEDLRLILVDPKRVEFTSYNGIPHLLTEVIVEPEKIISALKWTVGEMNSRYKQFAAVGARNLESYNNREDVEKMPYIIFIVDELADLMMASAREAEEYITRIAQMARATGIHLILATQRPSVNVITGLMKANIPSRIAFNVPSLVDSRVVLDMPGAEKLVGKGDMLYLPADQAKPRRIQGPYLSEKDIQGVVNFLKQRVPEVHYTEEVTEQDTSIVTTAGGSKVVSGSGGSGDPMLAQALDLIYQEGKASASLIQRRLSVGYARAARILDQLEESGYIGPAHGSKPRDILTRPQAGTPTETPEEMAARMDAQDMQDELQNIR